MSNSLFIQPFYHGIIRKTIVTFGRMFEGLSLVHYNANGTKAQHIKVPLQYAPKEKWLRRLQEDPAMTANVEIDLPRMSFEITGYNYDPARKLGSVENYITAQKDGKAVKLYTPVPYDLDIVLYSYTKTQEDALQILEQITPYFSPAVTANITVIDSLKVEQKIPFTLQGITTEDNWDGAFTERRMVIQTFKFNAKVNMYGPIIEGEPIKRAIVDSSVNPFFNKTDNAIYQAEVNPFSANEYDPHTIDEFSINND
jgi:hypothetical protein